MKKYWLYITHDVFIWEDGYMALIYNSGNGKYFFIKLDDNQIKSVLSSLLDVENLNCLTIEEADLNDIIVSFASKLRIISAGDIIKCNNDVFQKPISYPPLLNLQNVPDKHIIGEETNLRKADVIKFLHHLTINLGNLGCTRNNNIYTLIDYPNPEITPYSLIKEIKENIFPYKIPQITLLGLYDDNATLFSQILECISEISRRINIRFTANQFKLAQWVLNETKYEYKIEILFDPKGDDISIFNDTYVINNCNIIFLVRDNSDCDRVDDIVTSKCISNYSTIPILENDNFEFITENIFPTKEEILEMSLTKREIFCNQTLNSTKFGHLTVVGRNVYSDPFDEPIGDINEPFRDLVHYAIESNSSWMSVRSKCGCSKCLIKYLCPPISSLERALNKHLNINCFFK